jgi:hypothetical protein
MTCETDLDDLRVTCEFQELATAPDALAVVAFDMGADKLLGAHIGVVANQPVQCSPKPRELLCRQAVGWDQVAPLVVTVYFFLAQARHDHVPRALCRLDVGLERYYTAPLLKWGPAFSPSYDLPMDAERLNQTETRLEDLARRLKDLRGYL